MDVILDTCALLSLVGLADRSLSKVTLNDIQTADKVYLSACSMFEIAIKKKKHALDLGEFVSAEDLWDIACKEYRLTELVISHVVFYQSTILPDYHADPFDRIIIAHAINSEWPVVTFDAMFAAYDVNVIA